MWLDLKFEQRQKFSLDMTYMPETYTKPLLEDNGQMDIEEAYLH